MSTSTSSALKRSSVAVSGASGPNTKTIVFLHCLGSDQSMWRLLAPAFEEQYQVVMVGLAEADNADLTACGRAAHGPLDGHAAHLLHVMSELALHDTVLVGHSVGALIGMLAAVREPQRFAKMVLVSPSPRYVNEQDCSGSFEQKDINELLAAMDNDHKGWSQALAPLTTGPDEHPELVMELTNSFVRTNPEIARHFARVSFFSDSRAALPFLTIPTLIVQAANDVTTPLAVGHYLNEQLADSRMVAIETEGHCPHLSAPQETLSAMDRFLHHETAL